jgi:hypothetical protein
MSHRQEGGGTQAPGPGAQDWEPPEHYPRAALRWHGRLCREVDVSLEEAQQCLATLVTELTQEPLRGRRSPVQRRSGCPIS